jgi:hypothetical protein
MENKVMMIIPKLHLHIITPLVAPKKNKQQKKTKEGYNELRRPYSPKEKGDDGEQGNDDNL